MPANGRTSSVSRSPPWRCCFSLILVVKLHAFLALLISAMAMGLAAGMPPDKVLKSIQTGFGEALGFIAVVVGLGAMIGRFLEYSGGGRALADWLLDKFGKERAAWAMLVAAFLVGLPIFFEVGFIILVPLVWNLARETKRSLLFYGLPMAAALTMTHSLVPPHPAPAAASQLLGGDLGTHDPLRRRAVDPHGDRRRHRVRRLDREADLRPGARDRRSRHARRAEDASRAAGPGGDSAAAAAGAADLRRDPGEPARCSVQERGGLPRPSVHRADDHRAGRDLLLRHPPRADARQGLKMATESLLPMGTLICIMGGGGAFKQIIVDSGVGAYLGKLLMTSSISPLLVV